MPVTSNLAGISEPTGSRVFPESLELESDLLSAFPAFIPF